MGRRIGQPKRLPIIRYSVDHHMTDAIKSGRLYVQKLEDGHAEIIEGSIAVGYITRTQVNKLRMLGLGGLIR